MYVKSTEIFVQRRAFMNMSYDAVVIGGGVVGGLVLRELTKYRLNVCLLEGASDVAMGQSRANSGIVHAGFDAAEGSLKAHFNVEGNKLMPAVCRELGIHYKNNGSLVVAFSDEECEVLTMLLQRGKSNGVEGLGILSREELRRKEPNITDAAVAALYAPTGGIVCPYGLTIAAIGNAMDNGAALYTDFLVSAIKKTEDGFVLSSRDGRSVTAKAVVNAAGAGSGTVASLIGDTYGIGFRKGEYILLDRESGDFVSHTLFFTPTKKGKGILVSPTVDGNILLGPTAEEQDTATTDTSAIGLSSVQTKASEMCKGVPFYNTITSFAGTRVYSEKHDFIIEESKNAQGFFHCIGIESPGLTASPAIAVYVAELLKKRLPMLKNDSFNCKRDPEYFFSSLSDEEKNALIMRDRRYGKVVCRCEGITEGEIVRAIRSNPPARSVDAVKRRVRAGMGRCQGGFCQPVVAEIIARELGISLLEVTKNGKGSYLLAEKTK